MIVAETAANPTHARILLVEDSTSNRYVVSTWLRRAGYDVLEASTGTEGLDLIGSQRFDLAVVDINLPDMLGYTLCERIKCDVRTCDVPVLHVSATATQPSDRSEGLRRGAEGYLVEPVEPEELLATVEALLRGAAAQRKAAKLAQRLGQLNESALALNEAANLRELFGVIARHAALLFDSTTLSIVAFDRTANLTIAAPHVKPQTRPCPLDAVDDVARLAAAGPIVNGDDLNAVLGISHEARRYLAIGIEDDRSHRGTILVALKSDSQVEPEDIAVLRQYARAASTALRNVYSYDAERHIALMLQRNLLPDTAPTIPGLEIAVRYAASETHAEVGGDFYEIFSLSGSRAVIAIGDVVGHSLEAATVMAQLRTAIRCYALEGHSPAAILERLNTLLWKFHVDVTATACCFIFDRDTGRCEVANAGHLPPLHVTGANRCFLPIGGTLLGVQPFSVPTGEIMLAPGDLLVLYTDGLVERSGEILDLGMERLAAACADRAAPADAVCERLLQHVAPEYIVDDIAIIAVRRDA